MGGEVVRMAKLTPKQKRFVAEYLVYINATAAAKRAGYSEKTAEQVGYQLLQKTTVSAAIQNRRDKLQSKLEITQETVLQELASIAFASGADFVNVTGDGHVAVKATDEVPREKLPAIAGIKQNQFGVEIKLHDKARALELLGKHLGLFVPGSTPAESRENNLLEVIMEAEEVDTDDLPEVE